ncbi:MAG: Lrp/AsnC family transcriptional regulator, partial [Candidatus Eremiobacteraeota bacterium]|nr:Lrp/AsnC family transcriptional regulator [Candidatus Eremiobacteraeota bacterium]
PKERPTGFEGARPAQGTPDALDRALIAELLSDGRASQEQLSRRMPLSRPAVAQRMRRLEESGLIQGYSAVINWEMLGYPLLAFIAIRTANGNCRECAQQVVAYSTGAAIVEECHRITGEWCLLAKVRARTSAAVERFIDDIREIGNVHSTMTTLSLSTLMPDADFRRARQKASSSAAKLKGALCQTS